MVSCEIVTGYTWTPLVGIYRLPSMLEHIPYLEEALQRCKVLDPIVLGDLYVELDDARSSRSQNMAEILIEFGIIDLVWYFRQRWCFRDLNT